MCDAETFEINLKVLDEWVAGDEKFRLVYLGSGPNQLQIHRLGEWVEESAHFRWGLITARLLKLKSKLDDVDIGSRVEKYNP